MTEKGFKLTPMQLEYWNNANKKLNLKVGAAGSGKTFLDMFMIPRRILETTGEGQIVIMGNTQGTVRRNIIGGLQDMYGKGLVSDVSSNNTCMMFGKLVHVFGADNKRMKTKIQGMNVEYAYADEVATWSDEVFQMLMSRLRLDSSIFDGTCNPEGPQHWLKKFIDLSIDNGEMYYQHYTLDDGALSEKAKESQRKTLTGVHYDRLVLGLWKAAEGLIYDRFASEPEKYLVNSADIGTIGNIDKITIGVDFSNGGKAQHALVATAFIDNFSKIVALDSELISGSYTDYELAQKYVDFMMRIEHKYKKIAYYTYADSAKQTGINELRATLSRKGLSRQVLNSVKMTILERITATNSLIGLERFHYTEDAEELKKSLEGAVWQPGFDSKRLKDSSGGTANIDALDAFEYSFSADIPYLINYKVVY